MAVPTRLTSGQGLEVVMRKHPSSFKLNGPIAEKNEASIRDNAKVTLYDGTYIVCE